MTDTEHAPMQLDTPLRTDPRGFLVTALQGIGRAAFPIVAALYGTGAIAAGLLVLIPSLAGIAAAAIGFSWLGWLRRTYVTGPDDIRLEQGIISRSARSVPYERIQDVSLEQKFLPRLLGLAEIKFETGAGGKDELSLAYVSLEEAERLRELVRARKEGEAEPSLAAEDEPTLPGRASVLFAMDTRRVVTFGLFSFSLVIFAAIFGASSQFDNFLPFEMWDWKSWWSFLEGHEHDLDGFGRFGAIAAAIGLVLFVVVLGLLTGVVITLSREYGFTLERTAKRFRRRRGLFNKTDVVLPVHRVQAARIESRLIRKRFGWYSLEFVSLAQDTRQSSNHAVAPFATLDEIWPVARAAGIEPPAEDLAWHRPMLAPWLVRAAFFCVVFVAAGTIASIAAHNALPSVIGLTLSGIVVLASYLAWRRHRHASDGAQIYLATGRLAPRLAIAHPVKLQSAEIVQGPIARRRGYATLHLGLAGGRLELPGIPLAEARALRAEIVEAMAAVDFSRLPR